MNHKEIIDLIKQINKSNLSEFKLRDGDFELTIRTEEYHKSKALPKQHQSVISVPTPMTPTFPSVPPVVANPTASEPATPPPPAAPPVASESSEPTASVEDTSNYVEVKSPIVGTFYRSSSPEKPPYAKVGDRIEEGSVVCIVEAMKLFNEIESEISGVIVKVLVEDSSPVEYDQPLFLVDPKG